jgi:hypothetical protein
LSSWGGEILFDENDAGRPPWLHWLLGTHGSGRVKTVELNDPKGSDADLVHLASLTELKRLDLHYTEVGDAGLAHLSGLSQLQWLWLDGTQVSDAGLVHLSGLSQLRVLYLVGTQVTDSGAAKLRQALPNVTILLLDRSLFVSPGDPAPP